VVEKGKGSRDVENTETRLSSTGRGDGKEDDSGIDKWGIDTKRNGRKDVSRNSLRKRKTKR